MRKILIFAFLIIAVVSMLPGKPSTSRKGMRSSDLQKVVSEDGGTQRTDYVFDGEITYAADKHYATLIKTKEGNTLLERYNDENGQPEQQTSGHCALLREYDENDWNFKTTWLGADLKPVMNTSGYSHWVRTFQ